ncbi:hypothetical protein [Polynucleobacter sp. JS-Fieb-80-E5]|uniref:hypothetical protein n=1 Tax=Polynucleobacter sp. JS-Fieb-80-E5 TaxID=2081050 RepID=UPI001C0E3510|nr:hypothetical protein [Polynucleobacter sp. JS-Fieb-80-E5]MBU3619644.1 hypothetical protein [Polynucleobacter sp. JS-Fieb-80-E5]
MKNFSRTTKRSLSVLLLALAGIAGSANALPPSTSPYYSDPQSQNPKDQTQDTFQMASFFACFIKGMAPEQNVGIGQYLAYIDENKCNDNGSSASTSSGSGGSSQVPAKINKALVTVTQGSAGELLVDVLVKFTDENNGVLTPKEAQAKATIYSGVNVSPPYGKWDMDFCSSTVGASGSCNDGVGYVRVSSDGISVYNKYDTGYKSGKSIFTGSQGTAGYGAAFSRDTQWTDGNSSASFAFAPGIYDLKDRKNNQEYCLNPSTKAPGVRFSTWENYLYSQSTGERVRYDNPGFYLKSNLSSQTVGDVTSWGVNFWNEASSADQVAGAVLLRADDPTQAFTLKKSPGRLQRVTTSTSNGLAAIDGIPLNLGLWGNNYQSYNLINTLGNKNLTNGNGTALKAYWDNTNQNFVFTGYEDCSTGTCSVTNFSSNPTRSLAQLFSLGVTGMGGWVNGVNVNYNFNIANWSSSLNRQVAIALADINLVKQSSVTLAPNDSTIPASLVCVGTCPSVSGGNLVETRQNTWPPVSKTDVAWDATLGAPTVTGGGVTKVVSWVDANNINNGHYYQLFDANDVTTMRCDAWNGSINVTNGGYCTERVTSQANSTFYTWQSGNQYDAYNYLVYRSGSSAGKAVQPNPPINLSFTVPNAQGNLPGYIGKTITVQSPQPGNIWLPGNCIDAAQKEAPCSKDTNWVNSVSIPFATDGTGSVTVLDAAGAATSTQYFAKWLKRGVYFASLPSLASCSSVTADLAKAESVDLPGIADWNTNVKTLGLPWPTTPFDGKPRVVDGTLQ